MRLADPPNKRGVQRLDQSPDERHLFARVLEDDGTGWEESGFG